MKNTIEIRWKQDHNPTFIWAEDKEGANSVMSYLLTSMEEGNIAEFSVDGVDYIINGESIRAVAYISAEEQEKRASEHAKQMEANKARECAISPAPIIDRPLLGGW